MVYIVIRSREFFSTQSDQIVAVCKTRDRAITEAEIDMVLCDVPANDTAIFVNRLRNGADYANRWKIVAENLK